MQDNASVNAMQGSIWLFWSCVTPGGVRSSSLPTPTVRPGPETAFLPSWTSVYGAQLPHMLFPSLPSLGGLLHGQNCTPTSNHQVPAKQWASGQQLWPHNTCIQQRQSTTSESSLHMFIFVPILQFFSVVQKCYFILLLTSNIIYMRVFVFFSL